MNQHYAAAIDILMGNAVDYKNISIQLAKQNPELFCQLAIPVAKKVDDWHRDAINFMRNGNMAGAIKLCREKTGFGVKEAKDVIDDIRTRDTDHWFYPENLNTEQLAVYNAMIKSLS